MIGELIETIIGELSRFVIACISRFGYGGILFTMAVESACIPLPSEIIMPFSGYLVTTGEFTMLGVTLAGAVGNVLGSIVAYYAGVWGGRPFAERYGPYFLVSRHDLDVADRYLEIPHKNDFDLGNQLAFRFVRERLPGQSRRVADIFHRRGAHRRFKELLAAEGCLEQWYAFETEATDQALREWCQENDIQLDERKREGSA